MIATIKASSPKTMGAGLFEAIKHGLEYEVYADGYFDIIVHEQYRADAVAKACGGQIIGVIEKMPVFSYDDDQEMLEIPA